MPATHWICGNRPEAELLPEVENARKELPDALIINMFHPFRESKAPFPHVYYRDIISQQDEIPILEKAYALAKAALGAASSDPLTRAVLFGFHHDIAAWFTDYFIYRFLLDQAGERGLILISRFQPLSKWDKIRRWRYYARFLRQSARQGLASGREVFDFVPRPDTEQPVLVCGDDSGSGINGTTFCALTETLLKAGREVYFFALGEATRQRMQELGAKAVDVSKGPLVPPGRYLLAQFRCARALGASVAKGRRDGLFDGLSGEAKRSLDAFLRTCVFSCLNVLQANFVPMHNIARTAIALAEHGARAAVCVNEGVAICATLAGFGPSIGLATLGVPTVLLMDHPTCQFFPSERHLAYGEQHVELMIKAGVTPETIEPVGAFHFDRAAGRDRAADWETSRGLLPQWDGRPLVVIATEARPRQMLEIEPTIRALADREDWHVVIKLHPGDSAEPFQALLDELGRPTHMTILGRCDVLALVNASDLLITMGSNLIIEAAVMGRLSLSFNYTGTPCPIDFVAEGLCLGAATPGECLERIAALLTDTPLRRQAVAMLKRVGRYNYGNDGRSMNRIMAAIERAERVPRP